VSPAARDCIAWAADVPLGEARALYPTFRSHVGVVKVGLSLFVEHGPAALEAFRSEGVRLFLDLKLHDIPNTVELAATRAAALGVGYLTVHASGGAAMLRAAVKGVRSGTRGSAEPPVVLAVTALTSLDDAAVAALGFGASAEAMAARLADVAVAAGVGGLVCSVREAAQLRERYPSLVLCTPGIRPTGSDAQDQARAETPEAAISAGADLLVVGRPIHTAADPARAAAALHKSVATALAARPSR
jgi:orotidine-5'-phosphate decarboxylase